MPTNSCDFIIRPACNGDFEQVSICLKQVRGENYYNKDIYNPIYLEKSGEIKPFIAVSGDKIAATISVSKSFFENSFSVLGYLAVMDEFRNRKAAALCMDYVLEYTAKASVYSIKAHVVTVHNIMQAKCERLGFIPCGFLLGVRDSKNIDKSSAASDKRSLIIYVKPNVKKDAGIIYINADLKAFASEIYNKLNTEYKLLSDFKTAEETKINKKHDSHNNVLYIQAVSCGSDFLEIMKQTIDEYKNNTLVLFLNINCSSGLFFYSDLLNLGFAFSGLDPLGEKYECAVMCRSSGEDIHTNEIATTDESKKLLQAVKNFFSS